MKKETRIVLKRLFVAFLSVILVMGSFKLDGLLAKADSVQVPAFVYADGNSMNTAGGFAVFANQFKNANHMEGTIATKNWIICDNYFGITSRICDAAMAGSYYYYFESIDPSSRMMQGIQHEGKSDSLENRFPVVFPSDVRFEVTNNEHGLQIYNSANVPIVNGEHGFNNKTDLSDKVYKVSDLSEAQKINFAKAFASLNVYSQTMASKSTVELGTVVDKSDSATIVVKCIPGNNIVSIDYNDLKTKRLFVEAATPGADYSLVLNVTNINNSICDFNNDGNPLITIDGQRCTDGGVFPLASKVLVNFGTYSGEVNLGGAMNAGTILAPNASVNVWATHNGNVIANNVINHNGEIHQCGFNQKPEIKPTPAPTETPKPTVAPTATPTNAPTETPKPTVAPTATPTNAPTETPKPTVAPTATPTNAPTATPTATPTPTNEPTPGPTETPEPTPEPTPGPTETPEPTPEPTPVPTETPEPTPEPTPVPTATPEPTPEPTPVPTETPTPTPTEEPGTTPTPTPGAVNIEIDKTDALANGYHVKGATLMIEVVDSPADMSSLKYGGYVEGTLETAKNYVKWVSAENSNFSIAGLPNGKYKLVEVSAPTGFKPAADIEFEAVAGALVTKDNVTGNKVVMVDVEDPVATPTPVPTATPDSDPTPTPGNDPTPTPTPTTPPVKGYVRAVKVDENDTIVPNAIVGIYSAPDENALITDAKLVQGVVTFEGVAGQTYYIHEIAAPTGYNYNDEYYPVVATTDKQNPVEVKVVNTKVGTNPTPTPTPDVNPTPTPNPGSTPAPTNPPKNDPPKNDPPTSDDPVYKDVELVDNRTIVSLTDRFASNTPKAVTTINRTNTSNTAKRTTVDTSTSAKTGEKRPIGFFGMTSLIIVFAANLYMIFKKEEDEIKG